MKLEKFLLAAFALSTLLYSCEQKDEFQKPEEPGDSSITGLYLNEIASKGEDFIEIYNDTDTDINLNGFELNDGDEATDKFYITKDVVVPSKGYAVFVKEDKDSFEFGISDDDVITLLDSEGNKVDQSPALPAEADEEGKSWGRETDGAEEWVVLVPTQNASNNGNEYEEPAEPEATFDAEKGEVLVNEIYSFSDAEDWIELYNTTDREIDLGGMRLWEGGGSIEAWIFPSNTKIAAKSYLVVNTDKDNEIYGDPVNNPGWGLSKGNDIIVLANNELEIFDQFNFPSLLDGESYGRTTDGADELMIFATATKGTANGGGGRVPVVSTTIFVNEVYIDGSKDFVAEGWNGALDFIELYNGTDADVDLSGWEMYDDKGEDKFAIPAGTIIPAGGFVVFQAYDKKSGVDNDGTFFEFGLGKSGDWVFLYKPGKTELVDRVEIPGLADEDEDKGYTYGRTTDGGSEFSLFTTATYGTSNNVQ